MTNGLNKENQCSYSVRLISKIFRVLMFGYPRRFRERFAEEMIADAEAMCDDAFARNGVKGLVVVWFSIIMDWMQTSAEERSEQMLEYISHHWQMALFILFAVAFSVGIAWIDIHNNEVQASVIAVFGSAFVLGCLQPRYAWVAALILSVGLCAGLALAKILNWQTAFPVSWATLPQCFLSLIPGLIGAYIGAGIRWAIGAVVRP